MVGQGFMRVGLPKSRRLSRGSTKEVTIQKGNKASAFLWIREEVCLSKVKSLRAWQGGPILLMNNSDQVNLHGNTKQTDPKWPKFCLFGLF